MPAPRGGFASFLYADDEPEDDEYRLTAEQEDAVGHWYEDVWNFVTGQYPLVGTKTADPRPIIWTKDKMVGEVRPFPHYPYLRDCVLRPIFEAPRRAPDGRAAKHRFVGPKPRQVFFTNALLAGCLYDVSKHVATEWLIAKNTKPQAEKFVKERVRFMIAMMPRWFQRWLGGTRGHIKEIPAGRVTIPRTDSHITAVARNLGEAGEVVGDTTKVLLDEAIRLRNLRAAWLAADAQSPCVVAVSAPPERGVRLDPLSVAFFRELWEGLEEGTLTKAVVQRRRAEPEDDDDFEPAPVAEAAL